MWNLYKKTGTRFLKETKETYQVKYMKLLDPGQKKSRYLGNNLRNLNMYWIVDIMKLLSIFTGVIVVIQFSKKVPLFLAYAC